MASDIPLGTVLEANLVVMMPISPMVFVPPPTLLADAPIA
jgi:hypothetical protein